jgi:two-component system response regulator QseB
MKFLCIDDEALNLQVLTDMLQVAGASVSAHLNAGTALIDLTTNDYEMILVDLRMPGMDGVAFIEHVRRRTDGRQDIPIIVITAEGDRSAHDRCRNVGADDVLAKPVVMDHLFDRIGTVLARAAEAVMSRNDWPDLPPTSRSSVGSPSAPAHR